jgi:hypothetical protein
MRGIRLVPLLAAAAAATACLVDVERVSDPAPAFAKARAQAERAQGRSGPPARLHVLAWDPDDGRLLRVSLPMWIVREMDEHDGIDLDDEASDVAERVKAKLRWRDIEKAGLGILVEVEEQDGDRVLVWLS